MTSFFDTEIDRIFKKMSNSCFDTNDMIEEFNGNSNSGPIFYGYTMTIGSDGKPSVKEFGNARQDSLHDSKAREAIFDKSGDAK